MTVFSYATVDHSIFHDFCNVNVSIVGAAARSDPITLGNVYVAERIKKKTGVWLTKADGLCLICRQCKLVVLQNNGYFAYPDKQ